MPASPTNVDIANSCGLICAFALPEQGPVRQLPLDRSASDNAGPTWLHFNLADIRACNRITAFDDVPQLAKELLLDTDPHIRSEIFGDGIALVIGDLNHDFTDDPEDFGVLRLYIDSDRLITGRRHPLKSVDELRRSLLAGLEVNSTPALLAHLIQDLAEVFHGVIKKISDDVDDAEDQILAGRVHEQGMELGKVRRLLARMRRHVSAGRSALAHGVNGLSRQLDKEEIGRLYQALERLDGAAQDLELVQERARLLQEEIAGQLGEATNRNLYILSLMTTALLPINLITGVFGMNTGGLPWSNDAHGFSRAVLCMLIGVAISLGILHWRKIL